MKWKIYLAVAMLLFMICISGCLNAPSGEVTSNISSSDNKTLVKIGVVLPLTGDAAKYGEWSRKGYDLALEKINSQDDYSYQLMLIYEDDEGIPKQSVSATQKLISIDKVKALTGYVLSSGALPSAAVAEKNKIVLLSSTASAESIKHAGDYIFRLRESGGLHGQLMAEYCHNKINVKQVAVFYLAAENGLAYAESFRKKFTEPGGEIMFYESYNPGATDFRSSLTKIKELQPDAVYLPGMPAEIGLILKQAAELGLQNQFLSTSAIENPKIFELAGGHADGVIYTYPSFDNHCHENPCNEFVRHYESKYGVSPEFVAASSYDALMILSLVFKEQGIDSEMIKKGLYKVNDYMGVSGKISFDEYGEVVRDISFRKIINSTFVSFQP